MGSASTTVNPTLPFLQVFYINHTLFTMCGVLMRWCVGPDPADPTRILLRKLIRVADKTYCYEESRASPAPIGSGLLPTVHTTTYRVKNFDLKEHVSPEERYIRSAHRAVPNVLGFSMFFKPINPLNPKSNHYSIVENTLTKASDYTWAEWFGDLQDKRNIAAYLKTRWAFNVWAAELPWSCFMSLMSYYD